MSLFTISFDSETSSKSSDTPPQKKQVQRNDENEEPKKFSPTKTTKIKYDLNSNIHPKIQINQEKEEDKVPKQEKKRIHKTPKAQPKVKQQEIENPKPQSKEKKDETDENEKITEKKSPRDLTVLGNNSPRTPQRKVRFVTEEDEFISKPKILKMAPCGTRTIKVFRIKKNTLSGIHLYFRGVIEAKKGKEKQAFLAKAKSFNSQLIPITDSKTIHLKDKESLAMIEMESENSEFTVFGNLKKKEHYLSVKFIIPKVEHDSTRRMHVTFLGLTDIPSPIVSSPITSISGYEGKYMKRSIKNTILIDEKTQNSIISIRKVHNDQLEIDTHYDIPSLWLFSLGVISFLGKKPTR